MVSDGKGTAFILNGKVFLSFLLFNIGLGGRFLGNHGDYVYFCPV